MKQRLHLRVAVHLLGKVKKVAHRRRITLTAAVEEALTGWVTEDAALLSAARSRKRHTIQLDAEQI